MSQRPRGADWKDGFVTDRAQAIVVAVLLMALAVLLIRLLVKSVREDWRKPRDR